ncbi:MAG TPA: radical SAM/SPASM domain-containing protein [Thermodesulfovibrionales bacterium]|nr:radical SAM/SPASM domain-containing protein [Thermodesulfovibrionales bacterium]
MDPRGAHGFLNDREIEYSSEYCKSWPKTLVISMSSVCNILCRFCGQTVFHKQYAAGRNLSYIDREKLKIIFKDVDRGYPQNVDLQGEGEPLIQPDFRDVYMFCRDKFPYSAMRVCTNGVALTESVTDFLIEGNLAWLNVSLNAGSEVVHEKVVGVRVFRTIVKNIAYMQRRKSELGVDRPGIGMSFVLGRFNLADVENFIRVCADLGVKSAAIPYMTVVHQEMFDASVIHEKYRTNKMLDRCRKLALDLGVNVTFPPPFEGADRKNEQTVPPIPEYNFRENYSIRAKAWQKALDEGLSETPLGSIVGDLSVRPLIAKPAALRCTYPWDFIFIKGTGDALLCCGAFGNEDGNILNDGFWKVWNGPVRRFLRRTVNSNHVDGLCNVCPLNKVRDVNDSETHVFPGVITDRH